MTWQWHRNTIYFSIKKFWVIRRIKQMKSFISNQQRRWETFFFLIIFPFIFIPHQNSILLSIYYTINLISQHNFQFQSTNSLAFRPCSISLFPLTPNFAGQTFLSSSFLCQKLTTNSSLLCYPIQWVNLIYTGFEENGLFLALWRRRRFMVTPIWFWIFNYG